MSSSLEDLSIVSGFGEAVDQPASELNTLSCSSIFQRATGFNDAPVTPILAKLGR